jgi:hypothetical protein
MDFSGCQIYQYLGGIKIYMNLEQKLCHFSIKELSEEIENLEISPVVVVESLSYKN